MQNAARAVLSFAVFVATYFFVFWLPCSLLHLHEPRWLAALLSVGCAIAATWFTWTKTAQAPNAMLSCMATGALALGAVGFVAGFFGPMILTPSSNQGPLLGIFVTGPGGAVLGALGGVLYCMHRRRGDERRP